MKEEEEEEEAMEEIEDEEELEGEKCNVACFVKKTGERGKG